MSKYTNYGQPGDVEEVHEKIHKMHGEYGRTWLIMRSDEIVGTIVSTVSHNVKSNLVSESFMAFWPDQTLFTAEGRAEFNMSNASNGWIGASHAIAVSMDIMEFDAFQHLKKYYEIDCANGKLFGAFYAAGYTVKPMPW